MAPTHTALISYSHNKSCFLSVPKSIVNPSFIFKGLHIFKIEYGKDQTSYFSCSSDSVSHSGDESNTVRLNGKFALALGLKDNEQVLIQQIEKCSTTVERMYLEPLNSDDWEIMKLNSSVVEKELLQQIRVVSKEQVFPIWVNKASFFAKVAKIIPDVEPAILAEWTLIDIVPKERKEEGLGVPVSFRKQKRNIYKQYQHLRGDRRSKSHNSSAISVTSDDSESSNQDSSGSQTSLQPTRAGFSLFRYLMKSTFQNDATVSNSDTSGEDFYPLKLDFVLRVISVSKGSKNSTLPLVLQSTTVFISARTFMAHCHSDVVPSCFVARLSKLLSPQQRRDIAESGAKSDPKGKKKDSTDGDNKYQSLTSVCVNVVVLHSMAEEFDVPEALFRSTDMIAVPLELKRRLRAEISSLVHCQSVDVPPSSFDSIHLHPLEKLHTTLEDSMVSAEFNKWARGTNLHQSSVVLCDGTLVKLPINNKGKTCDFAIFLKQAESSDQPSPTSSPDSDKSMTTLSAPRYGFVNHSKLKKLVVKIGTYISQVKKAMWPHGAGYLKIESLYQSNPHLSLEELGGIKEISEDAVSDLEMWFKLRPMYSLGSVPYFTVCGSMLVYGPKGVGKSVFLHGLCKKLINYPHYIHTCFIRCLPLRGKRVETIMRKWKLAFLECVHRQPSLLVFDDLDHLASSVTSYEQEGGPDGIYYMNIAQIFIGLLEKVMVNNHKIVIIASSKSTHTLHPTLTRTKGRRVFQTVLEIPLPNREQRVDILQSLIKSKLNVSSECIASLPWKKITEKTESSVAQDLVILLDRAIHAAWVRAKYRPNVVKGQVFLIEEDFKVSFCGYTPALLRGLQLQKKSRKTWQDIGGLQEVKTAVQQILTWPVKYRVLYQSYGLKPQHNILLYGAPGTGKTLIASVVANECDMNFISIKGPELLSKYIGASEQGVRNLFNRAMVAKPCILFFDEFDALVPRRGHDRTGVTDRVVNQFLTHMDGVESLDGVYVLAATSRPELIDPALLRPGRIDKCLHCPLPDEKDRFEILQALSQKLSLADDVDFSLIAAATENFSGADLQALLYSAQVKAFRQCEKKRTNRSTTANDDISQIMSKIIYIPSLEKGVVSPSSEESRKLIEELDVFLNDANEEESSLKDKQQSPITACIEQKHFSEVLSGMKPSVSNEEREWYMRTYEKFQGKGDMDFITSMGNDVKRVTLA